jgi:hypothetical protein
MESATAKAMAATIAKYIDEPEAVVAQGLPYADAQARLDTVDVIHQVEWYRSQGLVKVQTEPRSLIDQRYVLALGPEN